MFQSLKEMSDAVKPAATVLSDRVSVTSAGAVSGELVDDLAWTAVFGADADLRGVARWIPALALAAESGVVGPRRFTTSTWQWAVAASADSRCRPSSTCDSAMAYDTARAVLRSAKNLDAGAFIFEIARSEIGYTEQRPHEYAAVVIAAALREGFTGPLFIQGDHVQVNAKKYNGPDRDKELDALRGLIREEVLPPASTTSTSTRRRWSTSTSRRLPSSRR